MFLTVMSLIGSVGFVILTIYVLLSDGRRHNNAEFRDREPFAYYDGIVRKRNKR